ncbi:hypothetical protein JOD45_002252 [Scopulibacillus daqui]|uniref:Uncharacterized protein n=1 Tax=Scopulibacillus daqui TaxID=1469162 RepID=A0ABS2Q3C2_9BACL|nr:hypothetical protein [Scopulibacillus daqui]
MKNNDNKPITAGRNITPIEMPVIIILKVFGFILFFVFIF